MDIFQIDKIVLFLIFFIPGFISVKVFSLLIPQKRQTHVSELFDAIFFSSVNYALFSWLIYLNFHYEFYKSNVWLFIFSLLLILLIFPIIIPIIFVFFRKHSKFLNKFVVNVYPKPWDFLFSQKREYWVIVHLTNGQRVGGVFRKNSYASSYPEEEQIYIEQVWRLDDYDSFIEPINNSKGMLILNKEISMIQFFQ